MRIPILAMVSLSIAAVVPSALGLDPARAISQYTHQVWRIDDGLPNSVVRGVSQTAEGYIWVATYDGLARYNGERFTTFDSKTLPGMRRNTVLSMIKARDGAIWIGTNGGGVHRIEHGSITVSLNQATGLTSDLVYGLTEGKDGTIWMGTTGAGVNRWRAGKVLPPLTMAQGLSSNAVASLLGARDGTVWIGTVGGGLVAWREGRFAERHLPQESINSLFEGANGELWVGTGHGLYRLAGGSITRVDGIPDDSITALLVDSDRSLWIGAYSTGLYRRDARGVVSHHGPGAGLLNASVRALYEDLEGNLWVGSNGGLERFGEGRFVTVGVAEGLSNEYTRCVLEDREGAIWVGTARGLNRIQNGATTSWLAKDGLASDYVFTIEQTRDGAIWMGTPHGVSRFADGRFTNFRESDGLSHPSVRTLFEDRDGQLWVGSDRGLNRYENGRFRHVVPSPLWRDAWIQPIAQAPDGTIWFGSDGAGLASYRNGVFRTWTTADGLPDMHLFAFHVDADGTLWIGSDGGGLIRFRDGKFVRYTSAQGLRTDKIMQIVDDAQGRLWIGTGRGILSIARNDLEDVAAGRSTSLSALSYGRGDGMRSVQCNSSAQPLAIRARDGRLWFATIDGVAVVDPTSKAERNTPPPQVLIESVIVDQKQLPLENRSIRIPSGAKQAEIHYTALTYIAPEKVVFRHRLRGFDDQYVDAGARRTAYFTGLRPGTYEFNVIAANADGVWNTKGDTVQFQLQPSFVQTRWFPIAMIAAIVLGAWLLHRARTSSIRDKAEELERLVAERTAAIEQALRETRWHEKMVEKSLVEAETANRAKSVFLANMSHELRTPLNAIIGFSSVLQSNNDKNLNEKQLRFANNISSSGEHLLAIINDILDIAKIEAGKMPLHAEPMPLQETLESVARVLRGVAMPRRVEVQIDMPSDTLSIVADAVKFKQIVYNLASNAIKFSPEGSVVKIEGRRLDASQSPLGVDSLRMSVSDRGIGIAAENHQAIFEEFRQLDVPTLKRPQGTGLGLSLVKKFVELHHGTIEVKSALGEGSTFVFILPLEQGLYAATA